jgi:muconolactone delta-isomerase
MKFLVIQRIRRDVPLETWSKLFPEQFIYLDALEKKGKIEISYHLIGHRGNVLIVDVDSDEELTRIVSEDPLFFQSEREIYPLTSRETHKRQVRQLLGY